MRPHRTAPAAILPSVGPCSSTRIRVEYGSTRLSFHVGIRIATRAGSLLRRPNGTARPAWSTAHDPDSLRHTAPSTALRPATALSTALPSGPSTLVRRRVVQHSPVPPRAPTVLLLSRLSRSHAPLWAPSVQNSPPRAVQRSPARYLIADRRRQRRRSSIPCRLVHGPPCARSINPNAARSMGDLGGLPGNTPRNNQRAYR